ncbi:MAG: HRDC domain-containing protein [Methanosarcinales archaeon]
MENSEKLETLINQYKTTSGESRAKVVYKLGEHQDESAIETLIEATCDTNGTIRRLAASALGKIGIKNENVINALKQLLDDEMSQVRQYAVKALGIVGDESVLDKLLQIAETDDKYYVRESANIAIGKIHKHKNFLMNKERTQETQIPRDNEVEKDMPFQIESSDKTTSGSIEIKHREDADFYDKDLEDALRSWRSSLCQEQGVPAYVIFDNRTLEEIVQKKPTTKNELRSIYGIGDARIEKYGNEILQIIKETNITSGEKQIPRDNGIDKDMQIQIESSDKTISGSIESAIKYDKEDDFYDSSLHLPENNKIEIDIPLQIKFSDNTSSRYRESAIKYAEESERYIFKDGFHIASYSANTILDFYRLYDLVKGLRDTEILYKGDSIKDLSAFEKFTKCMMRRPRCNGTCIQVLDKMDILRFKGSKLIKLKIDRDGFFNGDLFEVHKDILIQIAEAYLEYGGYCLMFDKNQTLDLIEKIPSRINLLEDDLWELTEQGDIAQKVKSIIPESLRIKLEQVDKV